jgi:hypothetical protein
VGSSGEKEDRLSINGLSICRRAEISIKKVLDRLSDE